MAFIFEADTFTLNNIKSAAIPLLYGGVMSVGIAYTCQIIGQKYADPTYASILLSTESVFGAIGGAIILGEKMNFYGYFGCTLIFIGILISQIKAENNRNKVKKACQH